MSTDLYDTAIIEVGKLLLFDIRDVTRDLLYAVFKLSSLDLLFINMHAGVFISTNHLFAHDDGILVIIAMPRHESYEGVFTNRKLAAVHARTVGYDLTRLYHVTFSHDRALRKGSVLVGA